MAEPDEPKITLDLDFLLLPSLEEMQDTSSDDVYAGPLGPFEETGPALEHECRDKVHQWRDIVIQQIATKDAMVAGAFPSEIILKMTAWLGSAAGFSLFYKLLKMWSGLKKGRKIIIKLPRGLHIEATQLSQRQFIDLIQELAKCGVLISKGSFRGPSDRFPYTENEKAFEVFLASLKSSGLEVFDDENMRKIETTLYHAFRDSVDQIRDAPDFDQRVKRAREKRAELEQSGAPYNIPYLSELEKQAQLKAEQPEAKTKKKRAPRKKKSEQP